LFGEGGLLRPPQTVDKSLPARNGMVLQYGKKLKILKYFVTPQKLTNFAPLYFYKQI
jgi:hypothetical protein